MPVNRTYLLLTFVSLASSQISTTSSSGHPPDSPPHTSTDSKAHPIDSPHQTTHPGYVTEEPPRTTPRDIQEDQPYTGPVPRGEIKVVRPLWQSGGHFMIMISPNDEVSYARAPNPQKGSPWPMPQVYNTTANVFKVNHKNFQFLISGHSSDVLEFGIRRARHYVFGDSVRLQKPHMSEGMLNFLNITVLNEAEDDYPSLDMDESYELVVNSIGGFLQAKEVWGAIRGVETFTQLLYEDGTSGQLLVNQTSIKDFPRFMHRGILLDTARHFITKENILLNLEAMAMNKMNVFHWHMTDHQSFPYQSKAFPKLSDMGAFHPVDLVYSLEDIADIVEQARLRGIRVIPEFDMPDHSTSWGFGQEDLLTPCHYDNIPNGYYGPMNPVLNSTYTFLHELLSEVMQVFKDKYIHLGGDGMKSECWLSNPLIKEYMESAQIKGLQSRSKLLALFEDRLLKIVSSIGKKRKAGSASIVWQEVFDNNVKLHPDTIVQVWKGMTAEMRRISNKGLKVIYSGCWMLNQQQNYRDWDMFYTCDHMYTNIGNLIGGEACMWTEYVGNEDFMTMLWPRAAGVAERLWSNHLLRNLTEAGPRIEEQRCRMLRRGLSVGTLSGPGYCGVFEPGKVFISDVSRHSHQTNRVPEYSGSQRNTYILLQCSWPIHLVLILLVAMATISILLTLRGLKVMQYMSPPSPSTLVAISLQKAGTLNLAVLVFVVVWLLWTLPLWLRVWAVPGDTAT